MKRRPTQEAWDFDDFPTHDTHSRQYWMEAGAMLHALVQKVVRAHEGKQGDGLAADVGAHPPQFSEALNSDGLTPGVKGFKDVWLPRVIVADRNDEILRFLCRLKGKEPRPQRPMNPRRLAHLLAVALLDKDPEAGMVKARRILGPNADALLDAALADEGEELP